MAYYNSHNFPLVESAAQAFADSTGIETTVHAPKRGDDFDATIHFKIRGTNGVPCNCSDRAECGLDNAGRS